MNAQAVLSPLVTVLMPVYNGKKHLGEALQSLIQQDFVQWNAIVVDDGSNDGSAEIAGAFADSRIRIYHRDTNQGISVALNTGIKLADTDFIARLDADDIALPQRLRVQYEFLQQHPDVGVVGTWAEVFGDRSMIFEPPTGHNQLVAEMLWRNPLVHSSVMLRKSALSIESGPYRSEWEPCEDYDLWARLSSMVQIAVIPQTLTRHRVHPGQISNASHGAVVEQRKRTAIARRHRAILGFSPGQSALPMSFVVANLPQFFSSTWPAAPQRRLVLAALIRWLRDRLRVIT